MNTNDKRNGLNISRQQTERFDKNDGNSAADKPGKDEGTIITGLAELPERSMLDRTALANALKVTTRTIQRMVGRFELPKPMQFRGRAMWMAGKVVEYLEAQAERLNQQAERNATKFRKLL